MSEISNENKAVNLSDLNSATTEIKSNILSEVNKPIEVGNEYLKSIDENISSLVPPKEAEIQEGKEEVIRQPCVANTLLTFTFSKKSTEYLITNNTDDVIFASLGTTCETGILIPSECSRVLKASNNGNVGSASVSIMPVASTTGNYDVVEVQQL